MKYIFLIALIFVNSVFGNVCPDGKSCPTDTTCCELVDKDYGCCPYSGATCCVDKASCCPHGYTCDLAKAECILKSEGSDFLAFLGVMKSVEKAHKLHNYHGIADIIKCIKDFIPVFQDVKEAIEDYKIGDKAKLLEILVKLLKDGTQMAKDCAGVIAKFIEKEIGTI